METTPDGKRAFASEHLRNLKRGAKRRQEEQIVGNWVRVTNHLLFLKLLAEASKPSSAIIDSGQLSEPKQLSTLEVAEPIRVEEPVQHRRPPPMMDIR